VEYSKDWNSLGRIPDGAKQAFFEGELFWSLEKRHKEEVS
jgi:hypothetical protein